MASYSPVQASAYRGRLAPSPTGYLHVGHARTFWTAWQRARDAGGTLVMRMEDLDPDRSRGQYVDAAYDDLRWLGIRWQEGPDRGGPSVHMCRASGTPLPRDVAEAAFKAASCFPANVRAAISNQPWERHTR